jgi:nucleoside-diphosphate-sugar epimerase
MISEIINVSAKPKFGAIPDRLYESPQIANGEETFRLLGYRPYWSMRDGIELTIDWYRNHSEFYKMVR